MSFTPASPGPGTDLGLDSRAERILKSLARVFQHDLPNQLVVFQGLVQLLEVEEADRLTPQGLEYLQRIKSVSLKTLELGRIVKEMSNLVTKPGVIETVAVAGFIQELKVELRQKFTEHDLDWQAELDLKQFVGDRRALMRCMQELLQLTFSLSNGRQYRIFVQARVEDGMPSLRMNVCPEGPNVRPLPREAKVWQGRMEYVLAGELLAGWGGRLQLALDAAPGVEFLIVIPG